MRSEKVGEFVIAVDVGGSKIAGGLWQVNERLQERREVPTDVGSEDSIIHSIMTTLDELARLAGEMGTISAIGIGIPGKVDQREGLVYSPVNLGLSRPIPLRAMVESRYKRPVFIDNDANAGAMGEAIFGAGLGLRNFIYLTIGTGIGAGIVIDGKIYRGSNGLAGEAGHVSIMADGPECGCGGRGCVENLASGRAITQRANEELLRPENHDSILFEIYGRHGSVTTKDVFRAARQGDKVARRLVSEIIVYLGTLLGNMVNLLDPEAIILGGGVGQNSDLLAGPLAEFLSRRSNLNRHNTVRILGSKLGEDSGILGAAALCLGGTSLNESCALCSQCG